MKKAFTLIELMVVIGIFGILMTAGVTIYVQVLQSANKASVEDELRQNLATAMDTIAREVRKSSCMVVSQAKLDLYTSSNCSGTAAVSFSITGGYLRDKAGNSLLSNKVVVDSASYFQDALEDSSGKTVEVTISLKLKMSSSSNRWDYTGTQTAIQNVSLRQISF